MKANNENSKKYLKLSHGIVKSDEKQVIIRFPLSRRNPVVQDDVKNCNDKISIPRKPVFSTQPPPTPPCATLLPTDSAWPVLEIEEEDSLAWRQRTTVPNFNLGQDDMGE